jgi:hypothetical protein
MLASVLKKSLALRTGDGRVDAFETVIAAILQRQGYWTLTSVKVDLSRDEKTKIGLPTAPRWELDVVAYRGMDNSLKVVECKSFLDSPGVECDAFDGSNKKAERRYKLFCDSTLRRVVLGRLARQLVIAGFCAAKPKVQLCLAAGKIRGKESRLSDHFAKKGWELMGPQCIRRELEKLRDTGYENSVAAVVTKMLLRKPRSNDSEASVDAAA